MSTYTRQEMMTVAGARALQPHSTVLVGIGLPSLAANLARRVFRPDLVLIYESGTIGANPNYLPLSIGDGELARTADAVVPLVEIFGYWVHAGRIDVGFLGAAQIDRYANINTTVIGSYDNPQVRLPGAGGAPAIAAGCRETVVVARHDARTFVPEVDFITTMGFGRGAGDRERLGFSGAGPTLVITDLCELRPHPETCELQVTALHPGVAVGEVTEATGWPVEAVDGDLPVNEPPSSRELEALRELEQSQGGTASDGAKPITGDKRGKGAL